MEEMGQALRSKTLATTGVHSSASRSVSTCTIPCDSLHGNLRKQSQATSRQKWAAQAELRRGPRQMGKQRQLAQWLRGAARSPQLEQRSP